MNLLLSVPKITNAVSWYRSLGPLGYLQKKGLINYFMTDEWNWVSLNSIDLVYFERPSQQIEISNMLYAKKLGIPIWVDYDDDLFNVPYDNPSFMHYESEETRNSILMALHLADAITVSTAPLKEAYSVDATIENKIRVVSNALHPDLLKIKRPPTRNAKPPSVKVLWRGSKTHERDLMQYHEEIARVATDFGNKVEWNFLGEPPWWIFEKFPGKIRHTLPIMDIYDYHAYLLETQFDLMIVPLANNPFNKGKSHIAWLEAAFAKIPAVIPSFIPDFADRPGHHYDNVSQFNSEMQTAIVNAMETPADDSVMGRAAFDVAKVVWRLENFANYRMELISELVKRDSE